MELVVAKRSFQTKGPFKASSASSWGLSGRVGMRMLMHRDMITCRFFRSLPRSWLRKHWGRLGQDTKSSSSAPLHRSSSPFSLSSPRLSSCSSSVSSNCIRSPVSRLYFPALKDRDREWDQAGPAASQALDGHRGSFSGPGMTISALGSSASQTALATSTSTAATSSIGHNLHYNNSSA